jgi:MFS family permease
MRRLTEQTKIEAQIGFLIGILIGAISGGVLILFFTPWEWYFKLFSAIGSLGIIGSLSLSLYETIKIRRNFIETQKEMEKVNQESNSIIKDIQIEQAVEQEQSFENKIKKTIRDIKKDREKNKDYKNKVYTKQQKGGKDGRRRI